MTARERITNTSRLQRVHCLADARSASGDGRHKPFAFIVSAKEAIELRFVAGLAHEQQQMTLLRFALHDGDFQRITKMLWNTQFEKLTSAIALDVHRVITGG